jgi:quinoprotein glucose dehydrogenase
MEATPLMIDNVIYLSTSYNRVVALNAETGEQLWAFDPKATLDGPGTGLYQYYTHRGVAFWRDSKDARVFMNSHWRLFSVDAKTGTLVTSFGKDGYVDLTEGVRSPIKKGHLRQTSPPMIYKNLVIVGSSIPDHVIYSGDPTGTVTAYDARSGKRVWAFYTVPRPGEFGNETWENDSWAITGHTNVWGPMSLDETRGLLYLPVSTPSSDSWGGRRPGANLFAESLVCLDAATGKRKWHFQAVHHGLWDYDFGAPPALITITVNGVKIDAVAEVSKQGFTYVFDRVTGKPVWPIEERPVDTATDVPGEKPFPTQPFPTKPAPFSPQGVTLEDANDLTPEIHAIAVEEMKKYRLGPLFTPPSLQGTLARPGNVGGANWGGAGFDPETGMLYVKPTQMFSVYQVCKNDGSDPLIDTEYRFYCDEMPAARARGRAQNKLGGIPLTKPPYAEVVALNLNKGDIAWRVPLGATGRGECLVAPKSAVEGRDAPRATGESERNRAPGDQGWFGLRRE